MRIALILVTLLSAALLQTTSASAHEEPYTIRSVNDASNHCNRARSAEHGMTETECFCWHYGLWPGVGGTEAAKCQRWVEERQSED